MPKKKQYQQMRAELDDIVSRLQSEDLDIDEAATLYEEGMKLIKELETYVSEAEVKIEKVKAKLNG